MKDNFNMHNWRLERLVEEEKGQCTDCGCEMESETCKECGYINAKLDEESVRMWKSDNPEGDKLVLRFLQGIVKKFDYLVSQAAIFVKERIKKLGY